jgi:anti-sigma factor RsiW
VECTQARELVEAIAAGDLPLDRELRAHIESCPACASALASAQKLEAMLAADVPPEAPPAFAPIVIQRIRVERWRSEQHVDRLFNIAIVLGILIVVGAVVAMLNVAVVFSLSASAWTLIKNGTAEVMKQAVPTIATYLAAVCLLASALGMWWWAERRLQF